MQCSTPTAASEVARYHSNKTGNRYNLVRQAYLGKHRWGYFSTPCLMKTTKLNFADDTAANIYNT